MSIQLPAFPERGCLVSLEGIEGVGKSTSLTFMQEYLTQQGVVLHVSREPGGTPIGESIRRVLLAHHDEKMTPETEALLLFAGRVQHLQNLILPAMRAGEWVLSDRFTDASYAYQGGGRRLGEPKIDALARWSIDDFQPDLTLLLDAPVEMALARAQARGTPDRIELEQREFFQRVRETYLSRAERFPDRYRLVDASQSKEAVKAQLKLHLDELLLRVRESHEH